MIPYTSNSIKYVDMIGEQHSINTIDSHKKQFGQYLTSFEVASYMSKFITQKNKDKITILDPGIGTGILSIAACIEIIKKNKKCKKISIIGYEIDDNIIHLAKESLNNLKTHLENINISLEFVIINKDFIIDNYNVFSNNESLFEQSNKKSYDIIISNPPYFKISKYDKRSKIIKNILYGQPNIYSIFMLISSYLLNDDGDLIFITPRSYTSGFYFQEFRKHFFLKLVPYNFHLFSSRSEAFNRDSILQENLIIHAKKRKNNEDYRNFKVKISYSNGNKDLKESKQRDVNLSDVIYVKSPNKPIFLPLNDKEESIISHILSWNASLHKNKMEISTGRVVPFRVKEYIKPSGLIPLIWINHIKNGIVSWPLKKFRKEQHFELSENSKRLLIPISNYILMRRFSAKEEKKRLNTAPILKNDIDCKYLAIENHVNYIYRPSGELLIEECIGLSCILNSSILDIYFRTYNGNTEVSATEIRDMPLPNLNIIKEIGRNKIDRNITNEEIDDILMNIK